jgi:hypothetical protein
MTGGDILTRCRRADTGVSPWRGVASHHVQWSDPPGGATKVSSRNANRNDFS